MRLTRVYIERFRAIDEIDVKFEDDLGDPYSIVTLAGPNGCGKTSILYAITNALRGVFGYRTDDVPPPGRDDIRKRTDSGQSWSKTPSDILVQVDISFSDAEQNDIRETLRLLEREAPPKLPNNKLTVEWVFPPRIDPDGTRQPPHYTHITPSLYHVRSWLQVKSWAIQEWRKGTTPGIAQQLQKLGGLYFFPQDRDLRHRVVGVVSDPGMDSAETSQPSRGKPSVHDVLDDFSRRFSQTRDSDSDNWESHVRKLYALVCSPKEYVGFRYRDDAPLGSPVFSDRGHEYPLSHAASGEHVILEYIIELCRFGPLNRSIVLIDEPEVHLHPLWSRRLYLSLPKMGSENQFILTTHAPEIRERAAADNALIDLGSLDQ